ncbi:hypothetical protein ZIOFF_056747 [Zingiber officinale]|uniref:Uncharacterized protein n=1 Tax=Zingiber officinale TaxID=94328 RepID=A0A8J5FGN3_ZINOF|nr:hypothetical protein ZIOFF_056747 [Zingiber officinale]
MDAAKRTVFHLSCLLLSFHGLSFTLLFIASVADTSCRGWWFPCSLSLTTSLVVTVAVQVVVRTYWRILRRLQREREDERALAWCVREMRMKDFDLSKEPQKNSKWMKSSSVEAARLVLAQPCPHLPPFRHRNLLPRLLIRTLRLMLHQKVVLFPASALCFARDYDHVSSILAISIANFSTASIAHPDRRHIALLLVYKS